MIFDGSTASDTGVLRTPVIVVISDGYAESVTGGEEAHQLLEILS